LDLADLRENLKEIDSDYDNDDEGDDAQIIKNLSKPFSATQAAAKNSQAKPQEEAKIIDLEPAAAQPKDLRPTE
jgi:hypothetical protein